MIYDRRPVCKKKGFFNFRLFDGTSDEIFTNRLIRVNDDRIIGIGDLAEKIKYPEYEWMDLNGCTLMPGLIDAHLHMVLKNVEKIKTAGGKTVIDNRKLDNQINFK
ncbi:MAG: hypothetical protein ACKVE4_05290 [Dissulfuribacterales bacterium]